MTLFKRSNDVEVSISPEFDKEYGPGETPVRAGIYRCRGCGCEAVADACRPLPLDKHPQALVGPRGNSMATGCRRAAGTTLERKGAGVVVALALSAAPTPALRIGWSAAAMRQA